MSKRALTILTIPLVGLVFILTFALFDMRSELKQCSADFWALSEATKR